ncbi:MAG: aminomethyl-transferring glycine dehydrogenase subunit GcvPB, partial [Candidatus Omnitrophica bacterium]|nr:aminomethyl-transferring glycine dehydrogenase subunit GcvPB [Candidatus Omnitrophota bacterium]
MELIFRRSGPGKEGVRLPARDCPPAGAIDPRYTRTEAAELPGLSEPEVVRHFTRLSRMNFGVDSHFYPLGSCTMKYNPKFLEKIANLECFASLHPLQPQLVKGATLTQGALEVINGLERALCEISGMDEFTTHPMAGAHGELTGVMLIAAYHKSKGERRKYILIPDSGHGTNPASAAIARYEVRSITT